MHLTNEYDNDDDDDVKCDKSNDDEDDDNKDNDYADKLSQIVTNYHNDEIDLIAFGEEPTFVEEFGTFTANLVSPKFLSPHPLQSSRFILQAEKICVYSLSFSALCNHQYSFMLKTVKKIRIIITIITMPTL